MRARCDAVLRSDMQIRPIQPSEIEAAHQLLAANGWERRVSERPGTRRG